MAANALVIGGSGFIGMHLLRALKLDGRFERVVSIDIATPFETIDGFEYLTCDARLPLPESIADQDTVIFNLPALRTFPGHAEHEYFETNLGTTERVIELARAAGSQTLLFTSTMSVYATGESVKTEDSPIDPTNAYGLSKAQAEAIHTRWLEECGSRRLIICRPAVIFGFRDNGNFTRLANALRGGYFVFVGRKDTIKSAGSVTDLVKSFLFALDHSHRAITYNFAYRERLTIAEIVEAFCKVGGFGRPVLTLPGWLLAVAALPFEALNAVGLRNPIHRQRLKKLYESTNIVPAWLEKNEFEYGTTLETALREWRDESADGRFI
jgi:GlcNAc-P-P-Und epimerase